MPEQPLPAQSRAAEIHAMLDDGLDELARYFAVVGQPEEGWDHIGTGPHMVCCVSVDDVRAMLRRKMGALAR